MEAQVSLTVAFSSSAFFGLLFLIFLLTIPHRFSMGFRSGEFAGQSSTPTPWSFNQLLVLLAVWAGAKSCWKNEISIFKKLVSRRKQEVLQNVLVNGCIYIYAFSRCFYPKRLTEHRGYTYFVSMCVPLESNPQPLRC